MDQNCVKCDLELTFFQSCLESLITGPRHGFQS